jgi:hypothetical protein
MFRPNKTCIVAVSSGKNDVYGQPLPARRVKEQCAVVKLTTASVQTNVRADSSASRGNARELTADAVILLTRFTAASINDIIEIEGIKLRVMAKHPRFDIRGVLDHVEVECTIWS